MCNFIILAHMLLPHRRKICRISYCTHSPVYLSPQCCVYRDKHHLCWAVLDARLIYSRVTKAVMFVLLVYSLCQDIDTLDTCLFLEWRSWAYSSPPEMQICIRTGYCSNIHVWLFNRSFKVFKLLFLCLPVCSWFKENALWPWGLTFWVFWTGLAI